MTTLDRALLTTGLFIPPWLLLGVWFTAQAYPGYQHLQQAMSQLGATGAPTAAFSPWVNNFPLALLFALFAWGLARRWRRSYVALASALLVLLHGVASLGTGAFACDPGCTPTEPSFSQHMHNLSGLLMFLSLTLASLLWVWLALRMADSRLLASGSLLCAVVSIGTVALMARAAETGQLFGLYQRINYGVAVLWIAALAWYSLRQPVSGQAKLPVA